MNDEIVGEIESNVASFSVIEQTLLTTAKITR